MTDVDAIIRKTVDAAIKADRKTFNVQLYIKKAVKEGIEAGRSQAEKKVQNAYKATERKLYAYPDLKAKVQADQEYLLDLQQYGLARHSADIVRFQKAGVRLSDEDLMEGLIQDIQARIAVNEYEIKLIDDALDPLTSDPYYLTISGRYFEQMSDDQIAEQIPCDPRTVRRNRGRLVNRVAIRLFGADAV